MTHDQRDQIGRIFDTWVKSSTYLVIFKLDLVLGKILNLLWQVFMLLGKFSVLQIT